MLLRSVVAHRLRSGFEMFLLSILVKYKLGGTPPFVSLEKRKFDSFLKSANSLASSGAISTDSLQMTGSDTSP